MEFVLDLGGPPSQSPRDRCQLDNSEPDSPEHYVYTWMIKFEIAGCPQHAAQMKVFVDRCRGLANSLYARPGKCFLFTKFRPDVPSSGCRGR